jgi:hypothetical protein
VASLQEKEMQPTGKEHPRLRSGKVVVVGTQARAAIGRIIRQTGVNTRLIRSSSIVIEFRIPSYALLPRLTSCSGSIADNASHS